MLKQAHQRLAIDTRGAGFTDITERARQWLEDEGCASGLLTLFVRHTSASLVIQENADPDVRSDLLDALKRLAPESEAYRHRSEGADDMPAHIKSMLTASSLQVPVLDGTMTLGVWQAIYLIEHRSTRHRREIDLLYQGTFKA